MENALQYGERTVRDVYDEHARMLYRIAFTYLKNRYDSEDALQECFLRYIRICKANRLRFRNKVLFSIRLRDICFFCFNQFT